MTSSSAGHSGPGDAVAVAPPSISHPPEASNQANPHAPDAPATTTLSASASTSAAGQQQLDATANQGTSARPATPSAAATANANGGVGAVANQHQPADTAMADAPLATPTKMTAAAAGTSSATAAAASASNANQADTAMANTDQFPPSTPFTPVSAPTLDQQAYMMMALAMSGAGNGMSPPPTVTPSQVTLPNAMDASFNGLAPSNTLRQPGADKGLESFARIEFADSVFQMTTYAVIIGRDQRALEQARRDEKREEQHKRLVEENASKGLPPPSPMMQDRSKFSKSYVSEEGGMLGPESDSDESGRPQKRRKTSTNGSSQQQEAEENPENIISNRQYVSHTPGAAAVDLASLRPSPWHVPIIGIHSPGPNIASKTKAISREHLKIAYNQDEGVFEAIPLHKNGFFCEDVHYKSDKVVLRCGDRLQIKDIDFRFMINGVERGRTGAEEVVEEEKTSHKKGGKKKQTHGGKEMSFEFEQAHGNGQMQDTSDELSDLDGSGPDLSDLGDDDEDAADVKQEGQGDAADPNMPQIPKKRGPGRPPKNGIMSKREQRLLKKQQQELAKKSLPEVPPVEPPVKRKVGRPRKHPLPDNATNPEKRKYKPRKPKGEDGAEGSDAERRAREKKEKKARPKSPPLELKIEDYTEEQLQKPNKNYGVLIDETLTAAGPDGLTLKQIYKRICQRYPWFYFHTETKGWESSVRHNLIGNEAFRKDETTNLWSRVPGVELDAGKKRKASSPDRNLAAQNYAPYAYPYNAQHMQQQAAAAGYPPGQVPPGYPMQGYPGQQPVQGAPRPVQQYQQPPNAVPGQQPQQVGQPGQPGQQPLQIQQQQPQQQQHQPVQPAPAGQAPVAGAAQPAPTQVPAYGVPPPAPARPTMGVPQQGSYSSPYASRPPPPPAAAGPIKAEDGAAAPAQAGHQAAAVGQTASKAPAAQGAAAQAGAQRVSATPPASAPLRPVVDPRLLQAVVGLKNGLVENLRKARNPKAEAIVMSALNRCIGLKKVATENDKMEAICIKGIRQVIDGFTSKNKSPTPGAATTPGPDEPAAIFETKVLTSLNGFKDVSVKALTPRLGEAKAEAVTLSAIDRVLGFVEASIMPPVAEGETPGNLEGVEQHLMNSIRQLLRGMNQKIHGQ